MVGNKNEWGTSTIPLVIQNMAGLTFNGTDKTFFVPLHCKCENSDDEINPNSLILLYLTVKTVLI